MDAELIKALESMECLKKFCKNNKCTKCVFYDNEEEMNCILAAPYLWGDFNYNSLEGEKDD